METSKNSNQHDPLFQQENDVESLNHLGMIPGMLQGYVRVPLDDFNQPIGDEPLGSKFLVMKDRGKSKGTPTMPSSLKK